MHVRALILGLTVALLAGFPQPATSEELRILLTEGTPPLGYRAPDGQIAGFNYDLARALCHAMGVSCRFATDPFKPILGKVEAGQVDIGFGNFLMSPERLARVLFSAPLWRSSSSLVGSNELGFAGTSAAEIVSGRRLAVVVGSAQHSYARAHWSGAILVELATPRDCFDALRTAKADLTIQAMIMALPHLKEGQREDLAFIGPRLDDDGLGGTVHAVMAKEHPDLKKRFDEALATLVADGTYHRISRQWLPFVVQ